MNLSHCHIQVRNLAAARRFYEELFEFREDYVCDEHEVFLRNSSNFVLGLEQLPNPEVLPQWFHFGFEVESEAKLRAVRERLQALDFPVRREIQDFGHTVNFYCADPDGTQIEVYFHRK